MKDQIMPFVIRNCYLNRFQSAFRSAHSTTTALLNVTDDFRQACERRFVTVLLLLDFSKAFDSVIHDLLCNKLLSSFNFDPTAIFLIRSYLSDRFPMRFCWGRTIQSCSDAKRSCAGIHIRPNTFLSIYQ
jgi:Reverse transcriptase (RNA-dependent DNA polymerase)